MNPDPLQASLFKSTSAFDASEVEMPELSIPESVTSPSQQLKKVANLIEDALVAADTDNDVASILEEALEVLRQHA